MTQRNTTAASACTERPLCEVSLGHARERRWKAGRRARGLVADEPFNGDPLSELYEELVDALNYIDAHLQQHADDIAVGITRQDVLRAAQRTMVQLRERALSNPLSTQLDP